MYWYAAEPLAAVDASRAAGLASSSRIALHPGVHGAADRRAGHARIDGAPGRGARPRRRLRPIDRRSWSESTKACAAVARSAMPAAWPKVFTGWPPTPIRTSARGRWPWPSPSATRRRGRRCAGARRRQGRRGLEARGTCGLAQGERSPAGRHDARAWCSTPSWAAIAVRGLSAYDDPATPDVLIQAYPSLGPIRAPRRPEYAGRPQGISPALLAAVEAGKLPARRPDGRPGPPDPQFEGPRARCPSSAGSGGPSARPPATEPG